MFSIPNLLTSCNLMFGCCALVSLQKGNFDWCIYFMVLAGLADFLDGFVAKRMKQSSELGVQLDSLSDVVSFGLVPGLIAFTILENSQQPLQWIPFFGFLLTLMAAFRLARFNVNVKQAQTFFTGLPVPASGLFFAGLLSLYQNTGINNSWLFQPFIFLSLIIAFSILMVSRLKILKIYAQRDWIKKHMLLLFAQAVCFLFIPWLGAGILSLIILVHIIFSLILPFRNLQSHSI
ncbi:MAG: CDP-alcohol phosphatidyltransferase family protein [Saprospiraceae bacterium]|nr:CDP-alcohol phosphatidyltransferase family protein [Saprospiraceae bacterium]